MYLFLKRLLDIIVSFLLIIILFPIWFLVLTLLLFNNKGRVFFVQARPGKYEKEIKVIKFKTMNDNRDYAGNFLPDKLRLTKIGKFARRFSLDELPQLLNVLKGDISLIGPRPLLFKYLPLYNERQRKRHEVKPGITGWAQVNGRNAISWKEKFEYDVYYAENMSFKLDVKIFFMTILKIIKSEGVNQSSERPMIPFNGDN